MVRHVTSGGLCRDKLYGDALIAPSAVDRRVSSWHDESWFTKYNRRKGLMADIHIVQAHSLTPEKARMAAQKVADKLASEYELACQWDGDVLHFERSGVEGSLRLEQRQAQMRIKLGFLFGAFSATIESKVADSMRKVFEART
jgi:putative polyhydroxyalkanoate system protein